MLGWHGVIESFFEIKSHNEFLERRIGGGIQNSAALDEDEKIFVLSGLHDDRILEQGLHTGMANNFLHPRVIEKAHHGVLVFG